MRFSLGHEAFLLTLAVGFAAVALYNGAASLSDQAEDIASAPAPVAMAGFHAPGAFAAPEAFDESTGSIATVGAAHRDPLGLDDQQRGLIFLGVINLPDVPDADIPLRLAAASVPASVELHDLPAMVTNSIPRVQGYKFAKLADRILVVHPMTRNVVAEIPRYHLVR
jgi:Protein of unknown function (DUF1236)